MSHWQTSGFNPILIKHNYSNMTYAILDIMLVALAAGMGITLLILPPSYQRNIIFAKIR
jgi:hypothetical protein